MNRRGFVAIEAILAGLLLLVLLQAAWWTLAVQLRTAGDVVREARAAEGSRLIHHVLSRELDLGLEGEDWRLDDDQLDLRAFRGIGVSCRSGSDGTWTVYTSGVRSADPDKDSILVLTLEAGWHVARLSSTTTAANTCPAVDGFEQETWTLDPPLPDPLLGQYFERGSYRFSAGAFRYRRGDGGWQPLTEAAIDTDASTLESSGGAPLRATVGWSLPGGPARQWSWSHWGHPQW